MWRRPDRGHARSVPSPSIHAAAQAATAWEHAVPVSFWITILLFVIVGFMLVNRAYWSNQRYEAQYRRKRFEQLQRQREQG
jgi:Na+/H+ antiporter NhaC